MIPPRARRPLTEGYPAPFENNQMRAGKRLGSADPAASPNQSA